MQSQNEPRKDFFFVPKTTKTKQKRFLKVIIRLLPHLLIKLCFIWDLRKLIQPPLWLPFPNFQSTGSFQQKKRLYPRGENSLSISFLVTDSAAVFLAEPRFDLRFSPCLQRKNLHLLLNVVLLAAWGVIMLACRFYWMGNKPPNFSNSDNPAADSPSLLTRTLTFLYLPAANFWLLLFPDMLSFDWSMDALPLVRTLADWRNISTAAFYLGLLSLAWLGLRTSDRAAKFKETNGKAHHVARNGNSNGHSCQWSNHEHANNNSHSDAHVNNNTQNGTTKHYESRTPLPTTENVVVFSLGLLAIPFLPATNLFFYVGFVIAERVLYIPSMGFCLLVAVGLRALRVRLRRRSARALLLCCSAALVLLFSAKTVLRNGDWQNEEMLYRSGIYVNPAKGESA